MECLDANVVQDLMSGGLDEVMRGKVLGHLDTCEDCRELIGVTARVALHDVVTESSPASSTHGDLALAETISPNAGAGARGHATSEGGLFGRYVLDHKLGSGAMGVVWSAHDPKLGRLVALKLLHRHDPALMDRLVREARSMAQVNHANVVGVYDVGSAEGESFIAMELVKGQSLRAWQTEGRRTLPEIISAYIAAGRGLAAAHSAGIIHRDFKADNVLVGHDGSVKVTDFGLAAAKASDSGMKHPIADLNLTTEGSVLGTPAYMAPEQFAGLNVDPRTDQFNFCATLYEALHGERPFEGKVFAELSTNVIAGRIKPEPAGTSVSSGLRAILVRGLSTKPGDRFPTMDHLLTELGRDRARPWRRTAWSSLAVAAALGLGLVADWTVRGRLDAQIDESFALTGSQVDKTVIRVGRNFDRSSDIAYNESAMREVAGHHDQADFGLGTAEADLEDLEKLHGTLASLQWSGLATQQRAVIDYKGRLLFTSYAPQVWNTDAHSIPAVARALDSGAGRSLTISAYADPVFAPSQIFGGAPPTGLVVTHLRTLALGNNATSSNETRAILLQFEDINEILGDLRLDNQTLFAIVAPDHTFVADPGLDERLVRAAPRDGIAQVSAHGREYRVLQFPIVDGHHEIAQIVMAREVDGVLTLFPHARLLFALATIGALSLALVTAWHARTITGARVV